MRTSLNHQPEAQHPKSPAIRWATDYPIFTSRFSQIDVLRTVERVELGWHVAWDHPASLRLLSDRSRISHR